MENRITRPGFGRFIAAGAALFAAATPALPAAAAFKEHHVSFHVDQNEVSVMNQALNNIANVTTYYSGVGEDVFVELVAYGPGLNMLREDTSPVKARLTSIKQSIPNVTFSACHVTMMAMEKEEGHAIPIVPEARVVPGGVVRLSELQEQHWSYIKP